MAGLLEKLPAMWACVWFDAVVAKDMRDKVVF